MLLLLLIQLDMIYRRHISNMMLLLELLNIDLLGMFHILSFLLHFDIDQHYTLYMLLFQRLMYNFLRDNFDMLLRNLKIGRHYN